MQVVNYNGTLLNFYNICRPIEWVDLQRGDIVLYDNWRELEFFVLIVKSNKQSWECTRYRKSPYYSKNSIFYFLQQYEGGIWKLDYKLVIGNTAMIEKLSLNTK